MNKEFLERVISEKVATKDQFAKGNYLFSNYVEHDVSRPCFIMITDSEIVICNKEHVSDWKAAGYSIFGVAHNENDLQKMIKEVEM